MERLTICETDRGRYAVRPMSWAGIWNEKGQIKEALNHLALFIEKEDAEKFVEWKETEEQGKLLKLPCANWMEIVFGNQEVFWGVDMDYMKNPIREITVDNSERMTWYDGWQTTVLKGADENGLDWEFSPEEVGKTVFLTKSAAEKALEEMEGKK